MIRVRRASERGHFDHGWLDTYHTFSFAGYYDPEHMGFRSLRVINEDRVAPGRGFGTHPHEDMEIVTYVLDGALRPPGQPGHRQHDPARRVAADDRRHGDHATASSTRRPTEPVHLYQIWLLPEREGLEPCYEQRAFPEEERRNRLRLVASPDGRGRLADDPPGRPALPRHAWTGAGRSRMRLRPAATPGCRCCGAASTLNGLTLSAGRRGRRQRRGGPGDPGRRAVRSVAVRPGLMPSRRRPTMPRTLQGIVAVLGRILLCTIFLLSAVGNKIPNFQAVAGYMAKEGVPAPQVMLAGAIVFLIAGSLSVILGYKARIGAALLLVFLVLATYYFHDFWTLSDPQAKQEQMIQFMKNLGLMGAMLLVIANGTGPMSLDGRRADVGEEALAAVGATR